MTLNAVIQTVGIRAIVLASTSFCQFNYRLFNYCHQIVGSSNQSAGVAVGHEQTRYRKILGRSYEGGFPCFYSPINHLSSVMIVPLHFIQFSIKKIIKSVYTKQINEPICCLITSQ